MIARAHGIVLAALLGAASVAGAYATITTAKLGESETKPEVVASAEIAKRRARLDEWEASLRKALKARPPALPALPRHARAGLVGTPSYGGLPALTAPRAAAPAATTAATTTRASRPASRAAHPASTPSRARTKSATPVAASIRSEDEETEPVAPPPPATTPAAAPPQPVVAAPAAAPAPAPAPAPPATTTPQSAPVTLSNREAEQQCEALKRAAEGQGEAAKRDAERRCEQLKQAAEGGD